MRLNKLSILTRRRKGEGSNNIFYTEDCYTVIWNCDLTTMTVEVHSVKHLIKDLKENEGPYCGH